MLHRGHLALICLRLTLSEISGVYPDPYDTTINVAGSPPPSHFIVRDATADQFTNGATGISRSRVRTITEAWFGEDRPVQPPSDIFHDSLVNHEVVISRMRTRKVKNMRQDLWVIRGLCESMDKNIISIHKILGTKNEANGLTKTPAGPLALSL